MKITLLFISLLISSFGFSQAPILIDGYFSDWNAVASTFIDDENENYAVDLLEFQVTNDDDYLYVHLVLNTEIQLMGELFSHNVIMYIDADNNSSTGYDAQLEYGTEAGMVFKQRFSYYNVTPFSTFLLNSIGIIAAPTITSNEFEIAIPRDAIPDNINPLFPSNTLKIAFQETIGGDHIPNNGQVFTYEFDDDNASTFLPIDLAKNSDSFIRIMAYNTLFDGITDSFLQDEYQRILQSIDPQIIGFSECVASSPSQIKSRLDQWLPSDDPNGWYVIKDDYDLITASLWPILDSWPEIQRQFPVLIDLPDSYPKNLLFTNAHLKCCDGNELRQLQVDEYAAFIADAKAPGGAITLEENTPLIYAGDLNLVGNSEQLNTLITGEIQNTSIYGQGAALDWDNSSIKDLTPIHSDANYAFTWEDESTDYTASRIDYVLFSDAVLSANKSFVLNTTEMDSQRLEQNNLQANDTYFASDHFPLVMDFSFVENIGITKYQKKSASLFPNPSQGALMISGLELDASIAVFNLVGELVYRGVAKTTDLEILLPDLNTGVYLVKIHSLHHSQTLVWMNQ